MGIYYETTYASNIEFSIITDNVLIWKDNCLVPIVTKLVSPVGCRWVGESMDEGEEKEGGGGEKRELKKEEICGKKKRRKGKSRKRRGNGGERRKRRREG